MTMRPEAMPPWWEEFGTDFDDEPDPEPGDFWPADDDDAECRLDLTPGGTASFAGQVGARLSLHSSRVRALARLPATRRAFDC